MVIFCETDEIRKATVRGIYANLLNKESISGLMLVLQSKINSYARKELETYPYKVEIFQVSYLIISLQSTLLYSVTFEGIYVCFMLNNKKICSETEIYKFLFKCFSSVFGVLVSLNLTLQFTTLLLMVWISDKTCVYIANGRAVIEFQCFKFDA